MPQLFKATNKDVELVKNKDVLEGLWNKQFSTTYELDELSDNTKNYLTDLVKRLKVGIVLDNGCGTGRIKKFFEKKGWVSYGTDLSSEALKIASRLSPINLICAPSHNLPFKDEYFDLIIFWRVLHNIPLKTRKLAMQESARILKKGGFFLCSVQSKEDEETLGLYKQYGIELEEDRNTYVVSHVVGDTKMPYLKHFFSREDILSEVQKNTGIKVTKISELVEKSGLKAVDRKEQKYWLIEAKK
ncbi:class I SAM-dependent methyltransferase [Candidatus Woesebacteria bacterium]|nr:class I SAM-dependent methyltransferase [Candidatus Woesebacteria bacterium]